LTTIYVHTQTFMPTKTNFAKDTPNKRPFNPASL